MGREISVVLGLLVFLTVLQHGSLISSAQITESFESGFGEWWEDWNYEDAYFSVAVSSLYAYDGSYSVELFCHGLPSPPNPKMSVWIERKIQAPASTLLDIGITFQLYSESTTTPKEVLAYAGVANVSNYPEFAVIGQTDQVVGWYEYTYQNSFMSGPTGEIFVAVGYHNHITGTATHWIDLVEITGISFDFAPPDLKVASPENQTTISDNTPLISADYFDESGIDTSSVILEVDGQDVTSSATVTTTDVSYTPSTPLSEGTHDVYLEVKDDSSNQNKATATWWFVVDTLPPLIMNPQPMNESSTTETMPTISAFFFDISGINTTSVVLRVDKIDVTSNATVNTGSVSYVPPIPLSDGVHNVHLEVSDKSSPQNKAIETWWFLVDTQPPTIWNLQPWNHTTTNNDRPLIGASYSDDSGIDVLSVSLEVDTIDVTSFSIISAGDISYVPPIPLIDGDHDVYLAVPDKNSLVSAARWTFTVDTAPPTTLLTILAPNYTDPMTTKTYVTSLTPLNLSSSDGSGVGVESISYLYYALGEAEPSYGPYLDDFTISSSKNDGLIYVKFKGRDTLGNEEPPKTEEVYLDNTPPDTDIGIGAPNHNVSGITYLTSLTPISFNADDGDGSGADSTEYQIKKDGLVEVDWTQYTGAFTNITGEDGLREILFKSEDYVGNEEIEKIVQVYLDNEAPTTNLAIGQPNHTAPSVTYVGSASPISFTAEDGEGSGMEATWYQIKKDGIVVEDWTMFTLPIFLSGDDGQREILFRSVDKLGNQESEVTEIVYLDNTAPTSSTPDYDDTGTNYINSALTTISIEASDGEGSGVGPTCYGIEDINCASPYAGPIVAGAMSEGEHRIYFRSVDNVGNAEAIRNITVFLDITPPTADAGEDVQINAGGTVEFDSSGSNDGLNGSGLNPDNCSWSFIYKGLTFTIPCDDAHFTFGEVDEYLVTLTVEDMAGNTGTDTMTVKVTAGEKPVGAFPWWVLVVLVAVVLLALILFLVLRKKKAEDGGPSPDVCENCGHEVGPNDTICPECESPVAVAPRR